MSDHPVVLKFGGSLLASVELLDRLQTAINLLFPFPILIIAGGGAGADLIRKLDQRFGLSPEKAHWDAIATMTENAALLCRLHPLLRLVENREQAVQVWAEKRIAVLDSYAFLKAEERLDSRDALPASWDVTSDSIALWTAVRWPAQRLILAKSCEPLSLNVNELVAAGSIDPWFTHLRGNCPIEWLNVGSDALPCVSLSLHSAKL